MSKVDKINQKKKSFQFWVKMEIKTLISQSLTCHALWKTIKKYNFSIILMSVEPSKLTFLYI